MVVKNTGTSISIDNLLSGLGPAVLKSIQDPFQITGNDYKIIWINESMGALYQTQPDEVIGKICYQVFFGRDEPCEECIIDEVRRTGRISITEKWKDLPDGSRRFGELRGYPVRGNDNEIAAIIVIVIDITRKKDELIKQKQSGNTPGKDLLEVIDNHHPKGGAPVKSGLTDRELGVLRLLIEGFTNNQISKLLQISTHTVKSHVISIFNKLGVNDRTQAAVLATRNKLI